MFVLVKWAEGITLDKGKFSIVTQSCVRGFDASEWLDGVNEEENQTFVIEWREGKNQLKGGWSVFLAQIIKVAERENTLEKVLRDYIDQPDDATAKKRTPKPNPKYRWEDEEEDDVSPPASKKRQKLVTLARDHKMWETMKLETLQRTNQTLREECEKLKRENGRLKDMLVNEIPAIKDVLSKIDTSGFFKNPLLTAPYPAVPKDPPATAVTPHTPPTTPGNSYTSVEIVKGSEVFCSKQVWSAAINAKTATSMVRTLLIGVFPMEINLKSNLKGGKSKRDVDGSVRDALEPAIINAVFEATMKRHPHPLVTQGNKIQWRGDEIPFIFNDSRQRETITFKRRRLDDVSPGGQGKNRNASYFMQLLGDRFRRF